MTNSMEWKTFDSAPKTGGIMEQNTDEWHEFRRNHVGSSDAPAIMGISPWKSIVQLYEEKITGINSQKDNPWMKRGRDKEQEARDLYCFITGHNMSPVVLEHPQYKFMSASLDGMTPFGNCAVEIKIPGKVDHEKALEGFIPDKYYPQLQHQIFVANLDMIDYFSWDGNTHALLHVKRDQEYIVKMIEKELQFWDCVCNRRQPTKNESIYPLDEKLVPMMETMKDLEEAAIEKFKWTKIYDALKEKVEANGVEFETENISFRKSERKGSIQYDKIPELKNIDLEKYRKEPSEVWTVRIKQND